MLYDPKNAASRLFPQEEAVFCCSHLDSFELSPGRIPVLCWPLKLTPTLRACQGKTHQKHKQLCASVEEIKSDTAAAAVGYALTTGHICITVQTTA